jgi:hypothetical protein
LYICFGTPNAKRLRFREDVFSSAVRNDQVTYNCVPGEV